MSDSKIRLQKYMAESGIASRRKSEELIAQGKVKVNGKVAVIGDKVDPARDKITVSGKRVAAKKRNVYLMLNKPRGYITTMNDEQGRKCVAELVKDVGVRVYPVGRLDRESEGLLLMTNDGELANALTHPSTHVPKTYRVTVRPGISKEQATEFRNGVNIDGYVTAPCELKMLDVSEGRAVAEVTIYEGKNRQIRKMFEALGIEVARLKRTKVGTVKLGMLKQGSYRELSEAELLSLRTAGGMEDEK